MLLFVSSSEDERLMLSIGIVTYPTEVVYRPLRSGDSVVLDFVVELLFLIGAFCVTIDVCDERTRDCSSSRSFWLFGFGGGFVSCC